MMLKLITEPELVEPFLLRGRQLFLGAELAGEQRTDGGWEFVGDGRVFDFVSDLIRVAGRERFLLALERHLNDLVVPSHLFRTGADQRISGLVVSSALTGSWQTVAKIGADLYSDPFMVTIGSVKFQPKPFSVEATVRILARAAGIPDLRGALET